MRLSEGVSESLERIIDIARRLSFPFEMQEVLERIVDTSVAILGADRASVLLLDNGLKELYSEATSQREEIRFPASRGLAGESLREQRILKIDDCRIDERFNPEVDRITGYQTRSLIAVPLVGDEVEVVGVLQLLSSTPGFFDDQDVLLAELLGGFAAVAIQRARNLDTRLRAAKLERDLSLARELQLNLLPRELPRCPGYGLAVFSRPAEETGGDIYDLVPSSRDIENRPLLIMLADATGHGIGAAVSVTQVRSMLRIGLRLSSDLDELCRELNRQLVLDLPANRFVTAFIGILDPATHRLEYQALGQAPILHYRADAGECSVLNASSLPLGLLERAEPSPIASMALEPGDIVVVLSDGFYEFENMAGEEFGSRRVVELLAEHRGQDAQSLLDALLASLESFAQDVDQADDLTAIILKRVN